MASDTRRLRVVVTGESQGAQQSLEQVGSAAEKTGGKLQKFASALATWGARGAVAFGGLAVAAGTMGLKTAAQLEQVEVGFTTMLGSATKAQKFMKELAAFAAKTPFEFDELTGSAQQFLAMGFAARDVIPMLTAVGDAVAAMGGSAENIDAVTRALGQMQAKGKVSGEELMQLTEQGIPALKILADSYGVSTSKMSKMIEKGQVMSDKAIPAIINGLENGTKSVKGFAGMMDKQSETLNGKWSTLMDNLKMGLGNLAKNLLPAAKVAVDKTSTAIGNLFAGIQGKGPLQGFSGTINDIGLGLRAMVQAFKDGDTTSDGLVGKFEDLGAAAKTFVDHLMLVVQYTISAVNWMRQHDDVAKALAVTIGALAAVTKVYATVSAVQAAGGLLQMIKNLSLVQSVMQVVTAVQWAYNGALAVANYAQIAGYLGALSIAQKASAAATAIATAAQWAFNAAFAASGIPLIIIAIGALIAAVVYLWKNNEGFRNFVLNKLWPSIKRAWDQLKTATMAVINALVTAWNWLKTTFTNIWNAIVGFIRPIIQALVTFFTPIFNVIGKIASFVTAFYVNVWKVIWILIQIAVKLFVEYFKLWWNTVWGIIQAIGRGIMWLYNNIWKPQWELIKLAVALVVDFFQKNILPRIQAVWNFIKAGVAAVKAVFQLYWNAIVNTVASVINRIAGPIFATLSRAFDALKGWLNNIKTGWNIVFDAIKLKVSAVMDGVVKAFNKAKDGIKKAWDLITSTAKKPVNFIINDVYNNRILPMWNKLAEKFGIKTRLDKLPTFARGGIVGSGYGMKDDQLALLTRGEGILTTKEMKAMGGPAGFANFRRSLAQYNKGGVVGGDGLGSWVKQLVSKGKDIIQGLAGPIIRPLVNAAKNFVNGSMGTSGITGLMRGGANTLLDRLMSWVVGKDKEIPTAGSGNVMGWRAMQALISKTFPMLHMISGLRPGAHTLTGQLSYHAMGRAVDYPANEGLAAWIYRMFGKNAREIITPWQKYNVWQGKPYTYTGAVWNQHNFAGGNAHVHWAMDTASRVQPGWFTGYNGTGKPETLVNADLMGGAPSIGEVHIHINGSPDPRKTALMVRDELVKLGRRNGGSTGLPNK